MKTAWKKWFGASGGIRAILTFCYVYVSFTITLDHTCVLNLCNGSGSHTDSANVRPATTDSPCTNITAGQNRSVETQHTKKQFCAACHYSLLSKSSRLIQQVLPVAINASLMIEISPHGTLIKQSEHLCSVSLRAPPATFC